MGSTAPHPHIVIFPFPAKGHTIPLLHLAHLIHRRGLATLTFFTTPLNAPFIRHSLAGTDAAVVELPFPQCAPDIPPNVESTDGLHSMAQFLPFVAAIKFLRPLFERALRSLLPTVSFLISDGFLSWTADSASELGMPRIVFYGMGSFSFTVQHVLERDRPFSGLDTPEKSVSVPVFPNLKLTEHDLCPPLDGPNPQGPFFDFMKETKEALSRSQGLIINSFYELEPAFFDYWNASIGPKAWCIGPLCLAKALVAKERSALIDWLDSKLAADKPVLYVAFGTQAEVSNLQLKEIAVGLEMSGVDFVWVVRASGADLGDGFESRVGERGKVVREWVDQYEILQHESVRGFVSHCGWNSVLESVCAGVPILAWPMMAEQPMNAKLVVDELRIGVRVRSSDGTRYGLVKGEDLARMVRDLMIGGERGKEAANNVKILAGEARKAAESRGSSGRMLEEMITVVSGKK